MNPQSNPVPQPTEGGELEEIFSDAMTAYYDLFTNPPGVGKPYIDAKKAIQAEAKRRLNSLIDAARNQGHAAQFAKDQAEIWPEAYKEGEIAGRIDELDRMYEIPGSITMRISVTEYVNTRKKELTQPAPEPKRDKE